MSAYRKVNGEMISVTTEGHPQYYFDTLAQAEAALSNLEEGADVFVEEGSNEDILPRIEQAEEDIVQINNDLTAKAVAFKVTTHNDVTFDISSYVDNANNYAWSASGASAMTIVRGVAVIDSTHLALSLGTWSNPVTNDDVDKVMQISGIRLNS